MNWTIHHVAVIATDYKASRHFYVEVLGMEVARENYRAEQDSWKLDLRLNGAELELFSMAEAPARLTQPEAAGLRHLAFHVDSVADAVAELAEKGVACEPIRIDPYTGGAFTFFFDPDGLPLELHE